MAWVTGRGVWRVETDFGVFGSFWVSVSGLDDFGVGLVDFVGGW